MGHTQSIVYIAKGGKKILLHVPSMGWSKSKTQVKHDVLEIVYKRE